MLTVGKDGKFYSHPLRFFITVPALWWFSLLLDEGTYGLRFDLNLDSSIALGAFLNFRQFLKFTKRCRIRLDLSKCFRFQTSFHGSCTVVELTLTALSTEKNK